MAELKVGGGIEVEPGKLEIILGGLAATQAGIERHLRNLEDRIPSYVSAQATGAAGASGDYLMLFGPSGPPRGYIWHVLELSASGITMFSGAGTLSAPAGTVFFFAGGQPAYVNAADVSTNFIDQTRQALPQTAFYSEGQFTLRFPDVLYGIVHSPTASAQYVLTANIKQELDNQPTARVGE